MLFRKGSPVYLQIAARISEQILAGKLNAGERLPGQAEQGRLFRVNKNTVHAAYQHLERVRIIERRERSAYAVSGQARATIRNKLRTTFFDEQLPQLFKDMQLLGIGWEEIEAGFEYFNKFHRESANPVSL